MSRSSNLFAALPSVDTPGRPVLKLTAVLPSSAPSYAGKAHVSAKHVSPTKVTMSHTVTAGGARAEKPGAPVDSVPSLVSTTASSSLAPSPPLSSPDSAVKSALEAASLLPPEHLLPLLDSLAEWCEGACGGGDAADTRHVIFDTAALPNVLTTVLSVSSDAWMVETSPIINNNSNSNGTATRDAGVGVCDGSSLLAAKLQRFLALLIGVPPADVCALVASLHSLSTAFEHFSTGDPTSRLIPDAIMTDIVPGVAKALTAAVRFRFQRESRRRQASAAMQAMDAITKQAADTYSREAQLAADGSFRSQLKLRDIAHQAAVNLASAFQRAAAISNTPLDSLNIDSTSVASLATRISGGASDFKAAKAAEVHAYAQLQAIKNDVEQAVTPVANEITLLTADLDRLYIQRQELLRQLEENSALTARITEQRDLQQATLETLTQSFTPRVEGLAMKYTEAQAIVSRHEAAQIFHKSLCVADVAFSTGETMDADAAQRLGRLLAVNVLAYIAHEKRLLNRLESRLHTNQVEHSRLLEESARYRALNLPHLADQQESQATDYKRFMEEDASSARLLKKSAARVVEDLLTCFETCIPKPNISQGTHVSELAAIRQAFPASHGTRKVWDVMPQEDRRIAHSILDICRGCGVEVPETPLVAVINAIETTALPVDLLALVGHTDLAIGPDANRYETSTGEVSSRTLQAAVSPAGSAAVKLPDWSKIVQRGHT